MKRSLMISVLAGLFLILAVAPLAAAERSMNDLAVAVEQSFADNDAKAFRKLIHGKSARGVSNIRGFTEAYVNLMHNQTQGQEVGFTVESADGFFAYNAATKTYFHGGALKSLAVPAEQFLVIMLGSGDDAQVLDYMPVGNQKSGPALLMPKTTTPVEAAEREAFFDGIAQTSG